MNLVYILITHISVIHTVCEKYGRSKFFYFVSFFPSSSSFPSSSFPPFPPSIFFIRCHDPFFLFFSVFSLSLSFYSLRDYPPRNSPRLCDSSFLLLLSLSLVRSIFFLLHSEEEERRKEKKCHCHRSDAFPLKNRDFYEIFPLYANFGVV